MSNLDALVYQYDELVEERRVFIEVQSKNKHYQNYKKYDEPYPHKHSTKTITKKDELGRRIDVTTIINCTEISNCKCDRTTTEWHRKYCPKCREFMKKESCLSKKIDELKKRLDI